jgi:hypothetical protein
MFTRTALALLIALPLGGLPMIVGCEDELEHSKSVDVKDDSTVVKKEKEVKELPDGSVQKEETHSVDRPNND